MTVIAAVYYGDDCIDPDASIQEIIAYKLEKSLTHIEVCDETKIREPGAWKEVTIKAKVFIPEGQEVP